MVRSVIPNIGFGLAPAGTSQFGFGAPASAVAIVGRPFDMTDQFRTAGDSRRIDPTTRDFVIDEDTGRVLGMTANQQRVYLALITQLGSSADSLLGSEILSIETVTRNIVSRVDNEVRRALGPLVAEGSIEIVSVDAYAQNTHLRTKVVWLDLTDNTKYTTEI